MKIEGIIPLSFKDILVFTKNKYEKRLIGDKKCNKK